MDVATETLYASESSGSASFKLVRLARTFRGVAITNLDAHITILGLVSPKSLLSADVDAVINRMVAWAVDVRDQLTSFGVYEKSIVGYLPVRTAPITEDILTLTARDTPRQNPFPGMRVIAPGDSAVKQGDDSPIKGQVIVDPFAQPQKVRPGRNLDTQIEVTVWDDKGIGHKLPGPMKVTLNVGQNTIEEVGAELTLLKAKLKSQMFWGLITKVELSVKLSGKLDFDQSTAQRLVGTWSAQLKSSLEFDLKVPKTSIGVHVEATLGVDQAGKPVPGIQFSWDF
jgi:hypothetical protein